MADINGFVRSGASSSEAIDFVNRPDEEWIRTIYNMDCKKGRCKHEEKAGFFIGFAIFFLVTMGLVYY